MSLASTAFIGWKQDPSNGLPFDQILAAHPVLRDALGSLLHGEFDEKPDHWPFVALASAFYAFNTYKAIGFLLPELYHESASVLLRQLWEVSLNLHWMEKAPEKRARDFCGFTLMEVRKGMQKTGATSSSLDEFDDLTSRFQQDHRFLDRNDKERVQPNFAAATVQERAEQVGEPWKTDYNLLYHLASMHTHGAPGAVLLQHFTFHSEDPAKKERKSTALVAYLSMKTMMSNTHLLVRNGLLATSDVADEIFAKVLTPVEAS